MARTIEQVKAGILNEIANSPVLAGLSNNSAVSIYQAIAYVVSVAIVVLENLFDSFRLEVQQVVASLRPHTLYWYQQKARDFQLGYDLIEGQITYDNTGIDPDIVFDSKIVEYASVTEAGNQLVVKVAQGQIVPLSTSELAAFTAYIGEIKDAGVRVEVISVPADRLRGEIDIYYDPTVLDGTGRRLDGTFPNPAYAAVVEFTKNLRFDGQFFTAFMVDALQGVEGITASYVRSLEIARDGDPNYVTIEARHTPFSGFVRVYAETDLTFNYIALDS